MLFNSFNLSQSFSYMQYLFYKKRFKTAINCFCTRTQDWSGKIATAFGTRVFWNWRWNQTWYPLLDVMIKDLDERRGVKAWIN